jgi:uncharacterized protein (TIGR03067 family)
MLPEPREAPARSSTFRLAAGTPPQIDLTTTFAGSPTRLGTAGIYSLSGDELTYCVAPPDRPRPTAFVTVKGDGYTLVTLKRAWPWLLFTEPLR